MTSYRDERGNTIQYAYDVVGNLHKLTYPDGKEVVYTYDGAGRLLSVTDWNDRVTKYAYDSNGRLSQTERPNGTTETRSYNQASQLIEILDVLTSSNAINAIIHREKYTYDANGNVEQEAAGSFVASNNDLLVDAAMSYGPDNRLATYNGSEVVYDADGNVIKGPLQGEIANYSYDSRNRLIQAGNTQYGYDAENNRVSITHNGQATSYVIDPNQTYSKVLVENGSEIVYYVYGLGLIGRENEEGIYLTYHSDRRGSTVALTDKAGMITDRYGYGPYGEQLVHVGDTVQPFLYNGQYGVMTDPNGLYNMRARYYNPEIKRFINRDVVRGDIGAGQTLNRYAYVNGNPISYIDPFGLSRDSDSPNYWAMGLSALLDFVPIAGNIKSAIEAGAGEDILTGDEIAGWERALTVTSIAIPPIKYIGKGKKAVKLIDGAISIDPKSLRKAENVLDKGTGELRHKLDLQLFGEVSGNLFESGTNTLKNFNLDDAFVKTKHLSTTGGNGAKFLGDTKAESEAILKNVMQNGKVTNVLDNGLTKQGNQSYEIIIDTGKTVGTRGETSVKIILSEDGAMLSAYPVK